MKRKMVAGLIIEDGKLLLVHNTKHDALRLEPPGGKKESNESWEESVTREIREELGIKVQPKKLFGIYDTHSPEGEFSVHMYFCDVISGVPKILEPDKISDFNWYSYKELKNLKKSKTLVPNVSEALKQIKQYL